MKYQVLPRQVIANIPPPMLAETDSDQVFIFNKLDSTREWGSLCEISNRLLENHQNVIKGVWDKKIIPGNLLFLNPLDFPLLSWKKIRPPKELTTVTILMNGSFIYSPGMEVLLEVLEDYNVHWLCLSHSHGKLLRRVLKTDPAAVSVLPRGCLFKSFSAPSRGPVKKLIYAGRMAQDKNVEIAAKMCREWGIPFECYGPLFAGRDNLFEDREEGNLEQGGLPENYHGVLDKNELQQLWKDPSVGFISLSSSPWEDVGMAAMEAMELGAPVLLSKWGGHKEYEDLFPDRVLMDPLNRTKEEVLNFLQTSFKYISFSSTVFPSRIRGFPCFGLTHFAREFLHNKSFVRSPDFDRMIKQVLESD